MPQLALGARRGGRSRVARAVRARASSAGEPAARGRDRQGDDGGRGAVRRRARRPACAEGRDGGRGRGDRHAVEPGGDADAAALAGRATRRRPRPRTRRPRSLRIPAAAPAPGRVAGRAPPGAAAHRCRRRRARRTAGHAAPGATRPAETGPRAGPYAEARARRRALCDRGAGWRAATAVPTFVVHAGFRGSRPRSPRSRPPARRATRYGCGHWSQAAPPRACATRDQRLGARRRRCLEFERVGVALAVDTPDGVIAP